MHILKKAAILLSTSFGVGMGIYPCAALFKSFFACQFPY